MIPSNPTRKILIPHDPAIYRHPNRVKRFPGKLKQFRRVVKRVQRIWRREGLKVPQKQPKRGSRWLNDSSCVRLAIGAIEV